MDLGEILTSWAARLAMFLYVPALTFRLSVSKSKRLTVWARSAWSLAFGFYVLHIVCAFHFYHDWSHSAAFEHTAARTSELAGIHWGGGLYANYAFTIVWLVEVCWWWLLPASFQSRSRIVEWSVHGFMGFIAFNAAVVFGQGLIRWFGVGACVLLLFLGVICRLRNKRGG